MPERDSKNQLRARDFWASLLLIGLSIFFLWKTTSIPLFGGNRAGVSGADWYNSAAIVPFGIFGGMLVLSVVLLVIAIRSGGAKIAFSATGIGWNPDEAFRFTSVGIIIFFYVTGLVPRVDFILNSGLLITSLIFGFYGGYRWRAFLAAAMVALPGLYALIAHLPQSEWGALDDDWVTLGFWVGLTVVVIFKSKTERVCRAIPVIAVLIPVILVIAMAFGFRQNVPARTGLLFKQIEYHYYVTLRPLWRD